MEWDFLNLLVVNLIGFLFQLKFLLTCSINHFLFLIMLRVNNCLQKEALPLLTFSEYRKNHKSKVGKTKANQTKIIEVKTMVLQLKQSKTEALVMEVPKIFWWQHYLLEICSFSLIFSWMFMASKLYFFYLNSSFTFIQIGNKFCTVIYRFDMWVIFLIFS